MVPQWITGLEQLSLCRQHQSKDTATYSRPGRGVVATGWGDGVMDGVMSQSEVLRRMAREYSFLESVIPMESLIPWNQL